MKHCSIQFKNAIGFVLPSSPIVVNIHGRRFSQISEAIMPVLGQISTLIHAMDNVPDWSHRNPGLPGCVPQSPPSTEYQKMQGQHVTLFTKGSDKQAAFVFTLVLSSTNFFYCHFPSISFFLSSQKFQFISSQYIVQILKATFMKFMKVSIRVLRKVKL